MNPYKKAKLTEKMKADYLDDSGKINPKTGSKGERRFDKKGELNAWDKKDALQAIAGILNDKTVGRMRTAAYRKEAELPAEVRKEVLLSALTDPSGVGMAKLGKELLA